jgi:hypothetical protein
MQNHKCHYTKTQTSNNKHKSSANTESFAKTVASGLTQTGLTAVQKPCTDLTQAKHFFKKIHGKRTSANLILPTVHLS